MYITKSLVKEREKVKLIKTYFAPIIQKNQKQSNYTFRNMRVFKVCSPTLTLPRTYLHPLLHNGEDPLYSNAEPHTRHLVAFGVKHAHQPIIAPTSSHTAHIQWLLLSMSWGV